MLSFIYFIVLKNSHIYCQIFLSLEGKDSVPVGGQRESYGRYCWLKYFSNSWPWPTSSILLTSLSILELHRASQVVLVVKNPHANAGDIKDAVLIPGSGRSPVEGHDNSLHYSCLENPMDRGAWRAIVHRVAKSWTWLKWQQARTKSYTECP